jgi:GrpB-like predicted nucleotidyltransferase (UPF0157 family)
MSESTDDPILARSREVLVGALETASIVIVDYDAAWPERFERERQRVVDALGPSALAVEHIGSTSVPALPAKPIIDVLLVVHDSSAEDSYLRALEDVGYELRVREPDWHEHRMLCTPARDVHIHVFSAGSSEVGRHLVFRDWLRSNPTDRVLYAETKLRLAAQDWPTTQHYAEAKTAVITEIMSRAQSIERDEPSR